MANVSASDAGIGRALFTTKLQLSIQAAGMCFWFGLIPGMLIPILIWVFNVTPQNFDIAKVSVVSELATPTSYSQWRIRDESGRRQLIKAVTSDGRTFSQLTPPQVRLALRDKWGAVTALRSTLLVAFASGIVGYLLVWFRLVQLGTNSQKNKRVRGAIDVVDQKVLNGLVRKRGKSNYKLVGVSLPLAAPTMGILVQGAQGSGKSLAIHDLMQQAFRKRRKCIIYDQSGEFYRAYFRPGIDHFFNPACVGSVPWSIFSELKYVYDADTLAQAFLPPKGGVVHGAGAFFEDAARALFSVIVRRLAEFGAQDTRDVAKAFFEMPDDEMDRLIEKSVASSAVGGDSKAQRQGVVSSIAIYLNGIAAVAPGAWSIRDFIANESDARLFILGTDDTKAMFMPLFRLLLAVSFDVIASRQEIVHEDRYWFFLDESHTLGDIKLDERLATLRKFGVSIVSGIQSDSQFFGSMGKERGETVMNCFNTTLMLRMNEPAMQKRAAARLGEQDIEMVSQNQALAVTEWRDGAGMARNLQEKTVVMASEIGNLDNCNGFLKLVGNLPAARVNYSSWLPHPFFGGGYVKKFAAVQESPERDPGFVLERTWAAGTVDPFQKVTDSMKAKPSTPISTASGVPNTLVKTTAVDQAFPNEEVLVGTIQTPQHVLSQTPNLLQADDIRSF